MADEVISPEAGLDFIRNFLYTGEFAYNLINGAEEVVPTEVVATESVAEDLPEGMGCGPVCGEEVGLPVADAEPETLESSNEVPEAVVEEPLEEVAVAEDIDTTVKEAELAVEEAEAVAEELAESEGIDDSASEEVSEPVTSYVPVSMTVEEAIEMAGNMTGQSIDSMFGLESAVEAMAETPPDEVAEGTKDCAPSEKGDPASPSCAIGTAGKGMPDTDTPTPTITPNSIPMGMTVEEALRVVSSMM